MSDTWVVVLGLSALVLLVLVNAVFVAAEFAFVGVRRSRIDQLAASGNSRAKLLLSALTHLDRSIATTQLGVTMTGLALGWLGEPLLAGVIEAPLGWVLGFAPDSVARTASAVVAFVFVTAVVIIFAELAPKSIALNGPERVGLWVSLPVTVFGRILEPFVWTVNRAGAAGRAARSASIPRANRTRPWTPKSSNSSSKRAHGPASFRPRSC